MALSMQSLRALTLGTTCKAALKPVIMTKPTQNRPPPKPYVQAIHAYVPGKSSGEDGRPLAKLSANENPLGHSPKARAAMQTAAAASGALYPDPDAAALRQAIAHAHELDAAHIVCGTGSDELLNLAAQGYAGEGDEVLYVRYGFAVYDIAARRVGATPVIAPDSDYATDIDALIGCITERTRVIFLANPNNPTGTLASRGDIARLHAAIPSDVLFVLDQAYAEYLDEADDDDGLALAQTADNVLVTRTFSKIYGLAGERIGWATGHADIIATLNRIRGPFNVTSTGQTAAIAALTDQEFVAHSRTHNAKWRDWLMNEIEAMGNYGLSAVPSHTNFVLVLFPDAALAETALNGLMEAGYIVRWMPGQGLPHALRITIGSEADMRGLSAALRDIMEAET